MDKLQSFENLTSDEYRYFSMLFEAGKSLECNITYKARKQKNNLMGYRVIFSKQKNNKALFWMEASEINLYVKANLLHIDDYADKMSTCSDTIKKKITATPECKNCHPHCGSLHKSYYIDKVKYTPCYFKGHYFSQMVEEDWVTLRDLLIYENNEG